MPGRLCKSDTREPGGLPCGAAQLSAGEQWRGLNVGSPHSTPGLDHSSLEPQVCVQCHAVPGKRKQGSVLFPPLGLMPSPVHCCPPCVSLCTKHLFSNLLAQFLQPHPCTAWETESEKQTGLLATQRGFRTQGSYPGHLVRHWHAVPLTRLATGDRAQWDLLTIPSTF